MISKPVCGSIVWFDLYIYYNPCNPAYILTVLSVTGFDLVIPGLIVYLYQSIL